MGMGGGGKGGGQQKAQINPMALAQGQIAKQLFGEVTPLRLAMINSMMSTFGMSPLTMTDLPKKYSVAHPEGVPGPIQGLFDATPTERAQIESQYGTAKENLRNTIAGRGSSFDRASADVEVNRALKMADLITGSKRRALGMAEGVTMGGTSTALSGLGSAAGSFFHNPTFAPQPDTSGKAGIGQGLGQLGAAAITK